LKILLKNSVRKLIGTQEYRKIYVLYDMGYSKREALKRYQEKLSIIMNSIEQKKDLP